MNITRRKLFSLCPVLAIMGVPRTAKATPTWTLDDLQFIADTIDQKYGQHVTRLSCSFANRRRLINMALVTSSNRELMLGEVPLTALRELGDDYWIAHTDSWPGRTFHFNPERRELRMHWSQVMWGHAWE